MKDIFWSLFEKSGNIDAFMAYKDFKNYKENENVKPFEEKNNNQSGL